MSRSVSSCALPRPSATASAKLAKMTVNQSQSETASVNQRGAAPGGGANKSRTQIAVVRTLPISTTNMTGFLATRRGASLRRLSSAAVPRMRRSKSDSCFALAAISEEPPGPAGEVLHQRAQRQGREERQRADDQHDGDEQSDEQGSRG